MGVKISELTAQATISLTDLFEIETSGGSSLKVTMPFSKDASNNVTFPANITASAGNCYLKDGYSFVTGTDSDFQYYHDGSDGYLSNITGVIYILGYSTASAGVQIWSKDSGGVSRQVAGFDGATPAFQAFGGGTLSFSAKASATYRTINFPAIPTSTSGLAAGDVWSNAGVLTIV